MRRPALLSTDAVSGSDRVVQSDPGVRITSGGPWTYSYRPITWLDDRSLLYTIIVASDGLPGTQIRRLTGQSTDVLATVPDAATNAVARLAADRLSVAWIEFELPKTDFNVKTTLVVRDNATGAVQRMALPSALALRFVGNSILVGAKDGLYVIDRGLSTPLKRISQVPNIENVTLVGTEIVFRSNSDHVVRTIAPEGGVAKDLDTEATVGPPTPRCGVDAVSDAERLSASHCRSFWTSSSRPRSAVIGTGKETPANSSTAVA